MQSTHLFLRVAAAALCGGAIAFCFVEGQVGKVSRGKSRQSDPMSAVEVKREAVLCNYSPSASVSHKPDYSSTTKPTNSA